MMEYIQTKKEFVGEKKIVLLTYGIAGCGGGQTHISNQIDFYEDLGYKVYVFYHLIGKIVLPKYKTFKSAFRLPELNIPISYFSSFKQSSILKRILKCINYSKEDDVIIESNNINQSMWGELLAKKISAKHFFYILGENDQIQSLDVYKYLRFKLSRKEIAGIVQQSIPNLFQNFEEITENESYSLVASAGTWWEDYDVEAIDSLPDADYNIGLFSRLEKPFVLPTLASLSRFCVLHRELSFNVIVVGGTDDKRIINSILDLYGGINNVNLVMTGPLTPPPLRYVQKCDLCLALAGCANLSDMFGKLTISFDGNDNQPIGVMHFTTNESVFRKTEKIIPLNDWLEDVFIHHRYPFTYQAPEFKLNNRYYSELHHNFIKQSCHSKVYYDMDMIKGSYADRLNGYYAVIKNTIRSIIGVKFYKFLHDIFQR